MDHVRVGNLGGGLASHYPCLGATGLRASCVDVCRDLSFVLPLAYRREKPPILRFCARHIYGDPDGLVPVRLGTFDRHCAGL